MMPMSELGKRWRSGFIVSRFRPSRKKLQKRINFEKSKGEADQDKGLIAKLIQQIKEMV